MNKTIEKNYFAVVKVFELINCIDAFAPLPLQEQYDNAGLITGQADWECTGVLCTLDCTEAVVEEAIANNCNLIVAHHPIVFSGLKKINGKSYVERTVIKAIKHDIAIYAAHTNLDNVVMGVNGMIAEKLGRGITVYNGRRGFGKRGHVSSVDMEIVFTVITRLEVSRLQTEIQAIDPNAFVVMHSIKDTRGGMIKKRPLHD